MVSTRVFITGLIAGTFVGGLFIFSGKKLELLVQTAHAGAATQVQATGATLQDVSSVMPCHVGPPYTSYTGTDPILNSSTPPAMGPAGAKLYETEFPVQNQIVRVTDENTPALLGQPPRKLQRFRFSMDEPMVAR